MKEESVYTTLRAEMTQTLFAFRQLLIGELGGYAALLASLFAVAGQGFHPYTFPALVAIHAVIGFLIVTTTFTGHTWLSQVFRQGSYILVALEIPALIKKGSDSKDRGDLWIMANRSESRCHETESYEGARYKPGTELHSFVIRQAGLSVLASGIMAAIVLAGYQAYFASPVSPVNSGLAGIAILAAAIPLLLLRLELTRSKLTLNEQTRYWLHYIQNRNEFDKQLLATYGIDLDAKSVLEMYGCDPTGTPKV